MQLSQLPSWAIKILVDPWYCFSTLMQTLEHLVPKTAPPPRQQGDHPFDILAIEHKVDTVILDSFVEVLGDAMSCEPCNNDGNEVL